MSPTTTDESQAETFRLEVTIDAPAEVVWQALRDPAEIRRWHGWMFDGLDEEIMTIFFTDVRELANEHTLVVSGGDTFGLEETGDQTVVRLTRAPRDPASEWDAWYDDINEGWTTFLQQMRLAIERHRGAERRTIYYSGGPRSSADVLDQLGPGQTSDRPVGGRYELTLAGEAVQGEVWFRTEHQVGLTVDSWGDGLVIVGMQSPEPGNPSGSAMAVLTTYGLPDATFADLERRSNDWWRAQVDATAADEHGPQR